MMVYVMLTVRIIAGLTIAMLIYLWLPENRKNRKKAVSRIDAAMKNAGQERPANNNQYTPAPLASPVTKPSPKHDRIVMFCRKYVAPYEKILQTTGYLEPINTLLALLDRHGDCASVVRLDQDMEYQTSKNLYDLLAKTSLLDHTLNVAEQMVSAMIGAGVKNPELFIGKMLVTALGHDIGKIPELIDSQQYSKGDHPYISYLVLKKVVLPDTLLQKTEILTAIKEHHYQVKEGLAYDLKTADHNAREIETDNLSQQGEKTSELVRLIREQKIAEQQSGNAGVKKPKGSAPETIDLSWLDLAEFLAATDPEINKTDKEGHFKAFSTNNGLVYLMLDVVSDKVVELARKHGHGSLLIGKETTAKKRNIEYTVKTLLDQKGFIPSFIGRGYSGARFALIDRVGKKQMVGIYMPIAAHAFKTGLADLEKRKPKGSFLTRIAEVRPLTGKKK